MGARKWERADDYDNNNRMSTNNNEKKNITIDLDNEKEEEQCERCGEYHCEDDEEHEERVLWESNKDGKNICRKCVREEDEEEDEAEGYCWKHEEAILPCEGCMNGVKCDDWEEDYKPSGYLEEAEAAEFEK